MNGYGVAENYFFCILRGKLGYRLKLTLFCNFVLIASHPTAIYFQRNPESHLENRTFELSAHRQSDFAAQVQRSSLSTGTSVTRRPFFPTHRQIVLSTWEGSRALVTWCRDRNSICRTKRSRRANAFCRFGNVRLSTCILLFLEALCAI